MFQYDAKSNECLCECYYTYEYQTRDSDESDWNF